ncbi:MAG: hypothetical protein JEZ07_08950 [Phycisphaerae bacterium]|nr:hypothetical protein [Phycisphaerae bacterium]
MAEQFKLGMKAKMYYGAAGVETIATLTELSNVRDVTVNHETGEADITTRANNGFEATAATLKKCAIDFEMVYKPGGTDLGLDAVRDAWINNAPITLAALTDAHDAAGAEGPFGDFVITNFTRKESLAEAIIISVTAKLAKLVAYQGATVTPPAE